MNGEKRRVATGRSYQFCHHFGDVFRTLLSASIHDETLRCGSRRTPLLAFRGIDVAFVWHLLHFPGG